MSKNVRIKHNKIFKPVHKSQKRYIVMKGSAGSGKSVDTAQQYILRLLSQKGRNLLCMRKSEVSNRDSTYAELSSAIYRMKFSRYFKTLSSPLEIRCINGNKAIFRGMNDDRQREKIKSVTFQTGKLTDIWLEEATEFTQEDIEILDDRLRGELPPGLFYQMKLTFNPVSANHWIKRVYFDRLDADVLTHHSTYLNNKYIDKAYRRRMERRKELDPEGYRVYGLGEWGELSGLIFTNWQVLEVSLALNEYDSVYLGQDFGFNHANCILLIGFKDGNIYILDEIYVYEMSTEEIIPLAHAKGDQWKKIEMFCDSAEPDRIKTWRGAGYRAVAVVKETGCERATIDWIKGRRVFVHPQCRFTIKELQQWKWRKDQKTGLYLDIPVDFFNDAMAALRYGVERARGKKRGIRVTRT